MPTASDAPDEEEQEDEADLEPAFGMLETVREYARERLEAEGQLALAERAHAHYFLALAERADPLLRGPDQRRWYLWLEREHDNLRSALRWLLDQNEPEERAAGLRLAVALSWFWRWRGYHAEGATWLEQTLARVPRGEQAAGTRVKGAGADSAVRIKALAALGVFCILQGECTRARAVLEEARVLAEHLKDPYAIAQTLSESGLRVVFAGEESWATRLLREALRHLEELGDPHGVGVVLSYLGLAADMAGDAPTASARYTEALQRVATAGDIHFAGHVHCHLAMSTWTCGELSRAVEHVQAAVHTSIAFRDRHLLSLASQATTVVVSGRAEAAARARLSGAADALAQATGATLGAWGRLPAVRDTVGLREQVAQEEWGNAYRDGRVLPFGQVATLALALLKEVALTLPQPAATPTSAQSP